MTTFDANPGAGFHVDAQTRADVTTAALAVLVDALRRMGAPDSVALACLRDAPEKIEAALTRGRGALVLYRLNSTDPRGIVTDDAARLSAFAEAAAKDGAEALGLNPHRIACLALAARGAFSATQHHQEYDI
ncbi:MAG: hypothetical protein ACK5MY_15665 [Jhaorihella sp.]